MPRDAKGRQRINREVKRDVQGCNRVMESEGILRIATGSEEACSEHEELVTRSCDSRCEQTTTGRESLPL